MILSRFPDAASERQALGYLAGRFSFKSWASGETLVPEAALSALAVEGMRFSVEGSATSEQFIPPPWLASSWPWPTSPKAGILLLQGTPEKQLSAARHPGDDLPD